MRGIIARFRLARAVRRLVKSGIVTKNSKGEFQISPCSELERCVYNTIKEIQTDEWHAVTVSRVAEMVGVPNREAKRVLDGLWHRGRLEKSKVRGSYYYG